VATRTVRLDEEAEAIAGELVSKVVHTSAKGIDRVEIWP
jgi:hypothetical protein